MILNDLIFSKAKQTREESVSFENSLAAEFRTLESKTGENVDKVNDQLDILIESVELENEIANKTAIIAAMFSKNSLLEKLVYTEIDDKLSTFPKKEPEEQAKDTPQQTKSSKKPRRKPPLSPPKKMASGGVTPGTSSIKKSDEDRIPYMESLALSLRLSGTAAITSLGEFLRATGPLAGFFSPYLKTIVKPFALAFGLGSGIVDSLLGGSAQAGTLELQEYQKHFGKTWGRYLNDPKFINQYIDREGAEQLGIDPNTTSGYVPAKWDKDPEFVALVNAFAQEWNLNAAGLLALMASESGIRPDAKNSGGCVGLIQFCPGGGLGGTGKTADQLRAMTRSQQWPYVTNYWIKSGLQKGMTAGDLYGLTHVPNWYKTAVKGLAVGSPARMAAVVATSADGGAYWDNKRLDFNNDGKITVKDYDDEVRRVGKSHGIKYESGGFRSKNLFDDTPFLMSGPDSGYKTWLFGMPFELHGDEVIVPTQKGIYVFPVENRRYSFSYDLTKQLLFGERGDGTIDRWKQIAGSAFTSTSNSFSAGGAADFWKVAALTSKEDSLHAQGQADVAQALYNRAAIGTYPGGRSIGDIITSPEQFEPTFHNAGAWAAIRDRKSAIAAAGNAQKVDMAAKSITNPSLQKQAQKFVGGRTDFMGESQKPYMKPGDVTRGPGYNFHGWFYDARLAKPAPVPKIIAAQMRTVASSTKPQSKVIVNRIGGSSQPNIIQRAQGAVSQFTNMIFNPHRLKQENTLRRL